VGNVGGEYGYWLLEGNERSTAGGFPSNPILSGSAPNTFTPQKMISSCTLENYNIQAFKNDNLYIMKNNNILYTRKIITSRHV
jgi:hypothetical protein